MTSPSIISKLDHNQNNSNTIISKGTFPYREYLPPTINLFSSTTLIIIVTTTIVMMIAFTSCMNVNALIPRSTAPRRIQKYISSHSIITRKSSTNNASTLDNVSEQIKEEGEQTLATSKKGRILVLGGTGYLGQVVCQKAVDAGYSVVTLSRRGTPSSSSMSSSGPIEYRQGDARDKASIDRIFQEFSLANDNDDKGNRICGVVHCIGLLFDTNSGLGSYNKYVSGSQSIPDNDSTYDKITRLTAFNAIDATIEYCTNTKNSPTKSIPFVFTSAAEAGWPDVLFGSQIERIMPEFIHRYMVAKRAVEKKLLAFHPSLKGNDTTTNVPPMIRPVIVRPSLIYSPTQFGSLPAVSMFTILNRIGVPFVDRPVTVTSLADAIIHSIENDTIIGIQRYPQIDQLSNNK